VDACKARAIALAAAYAVRMKEAASTCTSSMEQDLTVDKDNVDLQRAERARKQLKRKKGSV